MERSRRPDHEQPNGGSTVGVTELLRRTSSDHGPAEFLCIGSERLTFAGFAARVDAIAESLRQHGVEPGDRVAVLLPRCIDEAAVLMAAMVVGGIAVPVHGKLKDEQVRHVLRDAEPRLVVTNELRGLALQDMAGVLHGQSVLDAQHDLPQHTGHAGSPPDVMEVAADTPAVLLYTSGSTGKAKAIVQTHGNLVRGARLVADFLGLCPADHVLALLPLSFDYGLNQLLSALAVGCRLTAADHLGAGELANLLRLHRPTGLAGVPSLWHEVAVGLRTGTLQPDDGRSLRYLTNSGGALRTSDSAVLRSHWPAVRVFAMYGLTEAFRSAFLPPEEFDAHPDSFGRAIDGVELLLVDEAGRVLSGPATGELVHAGDLVARGYWRRPEESAARFRPDPRGLPGTVVFSGDLVRRDEAGRHYFVSRLDRMLKVQGHRVSPDEVIEAVAGMPGVGQVWVLGIDGGADGHHIALCFSGDPTDQGLLERVQRRCRARLPSYMMPSLLRVLAALPHNHNGKVDEPALRAMLGPCTDVS